MDGPYHGPALNSTWNLISANMLEAATGNPIVQSNAGFSIDENSSISTSLRPASDLETVRCAKASS